MAVNFGVSVVLARQLSPADFGLIGMLAIFVALASAVTDCGLSAGLVQRKTVTADDEVSVLALNLGISVIFGGLLCAISPWVAAFYEHPILVPLLCIQGLALVISALGMVQGALMQRNMEFHKTAAISLTSAVVTGVVGVAMAFRGYGVWSLAWSGVAGTTTTSGLAWAASRWRPAGRVRRASLTAMWGFSANMLGSTLIGLISQNIYPMVVGKVFPPATLGYYNRANSLRLLPAGIISGVVGRVTFPLFSRHQDDHPLLLRRLREIVRGTFLLSSIALAWLAVVANPLVPWLLTEKWSATVPLLRILCFAGVLNPISILHLMTLQALGRSELNFRLESLKMFLGLAAVALFYRFGIIVLAWSVAGLSAVSFCINAKYNVKLLGYRWGLQFRDIAPTLVLCAISGFGAEWLGCVIPAGDHIIALLKSVIFSGLILLGIGVFRDSFFSDAWKQMSALVRSILSRSLAIRTT